MSFHKLDKAKDKNFWSVRVSSDIRLIVHKTDQSLLLCYVDHHDKAYDWAETAQTGNPSQDGRRTVGRDSGDREGDCCPDLCAGVLPERRSAADRNPFFAHITTTNCSATACPPNGSTTFKMATEDTLLALTDHLPAEAAEALLELATGGKPACPKPP